MIKPSKGIEPPAATGSSQENLNPGSKPVLGLSEPAEEFLLALLDAEQINKPGEVANLSQLSRLAHLSGTNCMSAAEELARLRLVQYLDFGPGKSAQNAASFT